MRPVFLGLCCFTHRTFCLFSGHDGVTLGLPFFPFKTNQRISPFDFLAPRPRSPRTHRRTRPPAPQPALSAFREVLPLPCCPLPVGPLLSPLLYPIGQPLRMLTTFFSLVSFDMTALFFFSQTAYHPCLWGDRFLHHLSRFPQPP